MNILVTSIVDLKKSQHNRPHQFVRHLSKDHDVTVLSINDWWKGGQGDLESYSRDFDDIFDRIDYYHLTDRKVSPVLQEVLSRNKVNEIVETNDFDVHLNYSTLVSGYFAARKLKTVYDIADDLGAMVRHSPQIPGILRPVGGFFGDMMLKKNIRISERITLTTEVLRTAYDIPEGKSDIISNGVDTDLFRDHGMGARYDFGLDGFIIGYVGVMREWIDLEPIFSVLKELNDEVKLVVVGKEGRFGENVELAKRYGVEKKVIFTGMVPYSEVPKYISAMDVCIMPFREGAISEMAVPLKLFEYMACGKPVLSARLQGIHGVAGERVLYASGRDELKQKILALYEDEGLRKRLGAQGRRFVEENYDWSKIVGQMEEVLVSTTMGERKENRELT
ncbi:MAG: glycosyltransferase family 4 protein [ANME-2 cluster archaeon]|nr:glycosyltransferase family 4 protein [ANME-2 cluster archaeon]